MSVWVIVGGQYGSEGKGAFCAHIARTYGFSAAVRGGGPQAGHTFALPPALGLPPGWLRKVVRQVPVACVVDPRCVGYIGPGAVVDRVVLEAEIEEFGLQGRVHVHPNAVIVEEMHRMVERDLAQAGLMPGTTREGVGSCRAYRVQRLATTFGQLHVRGDDASYVDYDLKAYQAVLTFAHDPQALVMAEGTQGYALSLFHGNYPYVTSADATPASVLSECGLPVTRVSRVVVVLRTYPIRVGGPSGPLRNEITWSSLDLEPETTTVTGRERRIARFDWDQFDEMMARVAPTHAALMFCDYLDPAIRVKSIVDCPAVYENWTKINRNVPTPWIGVGGPGFEVKNV